MPSPDGSWREALLIGRHPDARLFSDREGAVWNFPAARRGDVRLDLTLAPGGSGVRISLADRWINPCDEFAGAFSEFSVVLGGDGCADGVRFAVPGERVTLTMRFDLDAGTLTIGSALGTATLPVTRQFPPPFGKTLQLSYLHLQSPAETADEHGVYLHAVAMKRLGGR